MVFSLLFRSAEFRRIGLAGLSAVILAASPISAHAATADALPPKPDAKAQALLNQYPSFSEPIHLLEENPGGAIHQFLEANVGKTVWLDTTITRYVPIDKSAFDVPVWRATTDRFDNAVYKSCRSDSDKEEIGIANFGEKGLPLPLDAADIKAGCATHIRFRLLVGEESNANLDIGWGQNKLMWAMASFFAIEKSTLDDGKTLYTLVEQDTPLETKLVFDRYKRVKERPIPVLTLETEPAGGTPASP